jgi:hypothetical protein
MSVPATQMPQMAPPGPMPGGPWNASKYSFKTWFGYESDIAATLNAAASVTQTFNIAGDSDFFWTKLNAFAQVSSAATTVSAEQLASVTILVTNTTSGRQYSSNPTPLPSVAGSGRLPFILPMVTLWEAKSTIQVQLANVGNANYSQLYLSFVGIKAFFSGSL